MVLPNFVRNIIREKYEEEVPSVGACPFVWNLRSSKSTAKCHANSLNGPLWLYHRVVISKVRKVNTIFLRFYFIYGNTIVIFVFILGFMFFGLFTYEAKEYFTAFTYTHVGLSIFVIFLLLKY